MSLYLEILKRKFPDVGGATIDGDDYDTLRIDGGAPPPAKYILDAYLSDVSNEIELEKQEQAKKRLFSLRYDFQDQLIALILKNDKKLSEMADYWNSL